MTVVFADAGYFIANLDDRDPLHERAKEVAAGLGLFRITTSQMVVTEFLNFMCREGVNTFGVLPCRWSES